MTILSTPGQIQVPPENFQRVDRGVTWSICCREVTGIQFVMVIVKGTDGVWTLGDHPAEGSIDDQFDQRVDMSADTWFKTILIPKLNVWLKTQFGSKANPAPTVPLNKFQQADQLIHTKLLITEDANGYLVASAKS